MKYEEKYYKLLERIDNAVNYLEKWGEEPDADMVIRIKEYDEYNELLNILNGKDCILKKELSRLTKDELIERIIKTLNKLDGSNINWDGELTDRNDIVYRLNDLEKILMGEDDE